MAFARGIAVSVALLSLTACSGTVVTGDGGEGGDSGTSNTSGDVAATSGTTVGATGGTTTGGTTTGGDPPPPVPCADSADCGNPGEDVCVFSLGTCAQRCGPASPPCPPGTICDECATGSCPGCRDCVGACMPIQK
jgi:hypothetical protein